MAYEDQSTTELLTEARKLLAIVDRTMDSDNYITSLFTAGKLFQALDARLSIGSDPLPDQWKDNYVIFPVSEFSKIEPEQKDWPVCFCDDCIHCGCNQPWDHHTDIADVKKIPN